MLQFGGCALASLAFSGCQSISGGANTSQVRIIIASPNAPGMDLYANATPLAYNLDFGNVTSYVPMSPGSYTVSANTTGTRQTLSTAGGSFAGAAQYTILLGDTSANLQQAVLRDQSTPAPAGQVALRFLDQATTLGPVDVYVVPASANVKEVSPLLTAQGFGANSGYLNLPAGTYRIQLYPAGAMPAIPLNSGPLTLYPSGSARTLLLLDRRPNGTLTGSPVQVVTANDFDPPVASNQ